MRPGILIIVLCSVGLSAGEPEKAITGLGAASGLPDPIASQTQAVLRINDPAWLIEQVDALTGSFGAKGTLFVPMLSETIFLSGKLDGIDLSRPALLAWRHGDAPLVAILPVKDRNIFFDQFGIARVTERQPLVRFPESGDGTLVFDQVTLTGHWQYRLLVGQQNVYMARTREECQLLAQMELTAPAGSPPVVFRSNGDWLPKSFAEDLDRAFSFGSTGPLADFALLRRMLHAWPAFSEQLAGIDGKVVVQDPTLLLPSLTIRARADTPLAAWIARQKNQSSRLLSVVQGREDLVTVHGAITWQGEMESFGRLLLEDLAKTGGAPLAPARENAVRSFFRLLDQRAAFALAWSTRALGEGCFDYPVRSVCEQQLAHEFLPLQRTLDQVLSTEVRRSGGEIGTVLDQVAYRSVLSLEGERKGQTAQVAVEGHLVEAVADSEQSATVAARTLLTALKEACPPSGATGVLAIRVQVARILAHGAALAKRQELPQAGDLALDLLARIDTDKNLQVDCRLPIEQLHEALRRSSIGDDANAPGKKPDKDGKNDSGPAKVKR